MKIFSLPALLIGAVILVAGGGIIYALTSHREKATLPQPAVVTAAPEAPPPAPVDNTPASAPDQPAPTPPPPSPPSPPATDNHPQVAGTDAPANPAGRPAGQHRGGQRMQQIYDQLGLTADQQKQLAEIRAMSTDREERREAMMLVLTPEQRAQLQELRSQMQSQRGNGQGGANGGNGGSGGSNKAQAQQQ